VVDKEFLVEPQVHLHLELMPQQLVQLTPLDREVTLLAADHDLVETVEQTDSPAILALMEEMALVQQQAAVAEQMDLLVRQDH